MRELLDRIDAEELAEWAAWFQIEGTPDPWLQTGQICATMANLWAKGRYKAEDFMPRPKRKQTPEEQLAIFRGICAAQEARVNARGG